MHRPTRTKVVVYKVGHRAHTLPGAAVRLAIRGVAYHYSGGLFWVWRSGSYVAVAAPVGAIVPVLPSSCTTVLVSENTYYVFRGAYYRRGPGGYVVVAKPQPPADGPPAPSLPTAEAPASTAQPWDVWISNPNGSRTKVVLTPADGGQWIGPRGEYYDAFPTEEQLLPVYGLAIDGVGTASAGETSAETEKVIWLQNANGSRSQVALTPGEKGSWIGPQGETYESLPTEDQLLPVYGLAAVEPDADGDGGQENE